MDRVQFRQYLRYGQWFIKDTKQLMKAIKAPTNLREYDVAVYGNQVIDYWNQQYAGKHIFKLFVFGSYGNYKPIYKYGPENFSLPLVLYFQDKHFDGIRRVSEIFGQAYCLACEQVYDKAENHSYNCKQRCLNCSRIGANYPCKSDGIFSRICTDCNKKFDNENCYKHHKISGFCRKSIKCLDCGVIWNVNDSKKDGRGGHICNATYCGTCHVYHDPKKGCFIEPLQPKQGKPYRLVAFDVETKQHQVIDPSKNKRTHHVNFIAASVACASCIKSGAWRQTLKNGNGCSICGKHRTLAFAEHDFTGTEIDKKVVTEDPVKSFIKWLLYELPLDYENVVYSHYGGRLLFRGGLVRKNR